MSITPQPFPTPENAHFTKARIVHRAWIEDSLVILQIRSATTESGVMLTLSPVTAR